MDGLVEELLRLEGAKHKALVEIDAASYDAIVREQMRLLAVSRKTASSKATDVKRLLALSQLITLNTRLLQNLVSTTPWFAFSQIGYTPDGQVAGPAGSRGVVLEA